MVPVPIRLSRCVRLRRGRSSPARGIAPACAHPTGTGQEGPSQGRASSPWETPPCASEAFGDALELFCSIRSFTGSEPIKGWNVAGRR